MPGGMQRRMQPSWCVRSLAKLLYVYLRAEGLRATRCLASLVFLSDIPPPVYFRSSHETPIGICRHIACVGRAQRVEHLPHS